MEPSAGSGNFIDSLIKFGINKEKIKAFDIEPKSDNIVKADYLEKKIKYSSKRIVIGNPPFGKRAKLAIDFINKGLIEADIVAMILPKTLNRYSAQKQIDNNAILIHTQDIEDDAFLINDRRYHVSCIFQVWIKCETKLSNYRILTPPPNKHDDFETKIHNNTELTWKKYFDKNEFNWDFAVHRQGYYDYEKIITDPNDLIKNRQYMFFKAKNKTILNKLKKMDFKELSKSNTQTPGFSTTDVVSEYERKKVKNDARKTIK